MTTIRLEFRRKLLHITSGILAVIALKYWGLGIFFFMLLLVVGLLVSVISSRHRLPLIGWFLDTFDRPGGPLPGWGSITYVISVILLLGFFGKGDITYASIMILALGDSVSSMVGMRLEKSTRLWKTRHPLSADKLLEGTLFGFVAASLGAMLFVSISEAVVASAVAMTVETIEFRVRKHPVDDNVLVPLSAALALFLFRMLF